MNAKCQVRKIIGLLNMKRHYFYPLLIFLILIFRALVFADRGTIIWPPSVHLNQTAQNAIVAWDGQEEIIILSTNIESSGLATALEVLPLPSNPTEIKEADPNCFEKLVELMNEKLEAIRQDYINRGRGGDAPDAGIEVTFHEKIGAHDVTVVKVNDLDYFLNWIGQFAQDKGLEVKEISPAFRDGVANYLKREIEYFVFDVVNAAEGEESVKPLIYRFHSDCLYYPLLISGISEIGQSEAEVNLFLLTTKQAYIFDPPYSYYRYGWFYSYGFPVELNEEELQEVSGDLGDLFEGQVKAQKASLYGKLNQTTKDLSLYSFYFWDKDLALGSSGEEVKALQKILINEGVWDSDQKATGYFGEVTKNALAKFQEKYLGLTPGTGNFDPETREYFKKLSIKPWGQIIYVDDDATGANDGSSWTDSYNHLQDALAAASNGDEIRVAQGIYKPDQGANQTSGDRYATFQLINDVTLKGGYAGYGAADPNERDIRLYETILSGDLLGNDDPIGDPCDLLNDPCRAENSLHVVTGRRTDETAIIDGFTITSGNADSPLDKWGGGIYLRDSNSVISNCTINRNTSVSGGGAIHFNCRSLSPYITACTISQNSTDGLGGGICAAYEGNTIINNCKFLENSALRSGGAIHLHGTEAIIKKCEIIGNSAGETGGGVQYEVHIRSGSLKMSNCVVTGNAAVQGGGIYCHLSYGAGFISDITNSILWANEALEGPQIYFSGERSARLSYSDIQGGVNNIYIDPSNDLIWGPGNIDADPCFADANDFHLKSQAGRWEPSSGSWVKDDVTSPCIDAGDMSSPIGYEPFPNGGIINMGAYGGTAEASKSYFGEPICETIVAGDINGDCRVNFADFAFMALHWLGAYTPASPSTPPGQATNPNPPDGAMEVDTYAYLSWTPGLNAISHNVYFGTITPPPFIHNQIDTTFDPGTMAQLTEYFWRIDEVNPIGTTTGPVWSFTTTKMRCFPANTLVWVDGKLIQIAKVMPGQKISKLDDALFGTSLQQIESIDEHEGTFECYDIILENRNRISVIDAHRFLLDYDKWVPVQNLRVGSKLKSLNGPISISSISKRATPFVGKVYNLKVKDSERYFVGEDGIIVRDF